MLRLHGNDYVDVVQEIGNTDYIDNGEIHKNAPMRAVMVSAEADLDDLGEYGVGTIAYTAGFGSMWQKGIDGTWEVIV